ncbi:MAG: hypothetical protein JXB62_07250 [Pirellulales bacterium]|nr:hypothetical protein [Pirellulales bacterium]
MSQPTTNPRSRGPYGPAARRIRPVDRHRATWLLILGLSLAAISGCSRSFYRRQADRQVQSLVECAAGDPRWPLEDFSIRPDPASRMFDPDDPDCPPMPPDDPTSHQLMHCVDCKPGWPCWRHCGMTPFVENPNWRDCLPRDENGLVVLDREGAVEMALLHSRAYRKALEDLYLSALDVTLERFRFDVQFFGGNSTYFTADGPDRAGGRQSTLQTDTDLRMEKLFAGGGELVAGMANSLVWTFAGPDNYGANTLLDFSLVQPLLRGGGRAVVLESLTSAERDLLANIRQMERFRRGFYTQIVAGRNALPGPNPGGLRFTGVSTDTIRSAGGFLGLLRQQVEIRNQRSNVAGLRSSLDRLQAFYEGGLVSSQQVGLTRQGLYDAQSRLLQITANHEQELDAYKILLGLPPELSLKIDDSLLASFDLIAPSLTATQDAVAGVLGRMGEMADAEEIGPQEDLLADVETICREVAEQLALVRADVERLIDSLPAREQSLQRLTTREEFKRGEVDPRIFSIEGMRSRSVELVGELEGIERARQLAGRLGVAMPEEADQGEEALVPKTALGAADQRGPIAERLKSTLAGLEQFSEGKGLPGADAAASGEELKELVRRLSDELLDLSLIQAGARLDTVTLKPVEIDSQEAFEIARIHRRDWMNARAALVDSWRQVEVTANDLQSELDVVFRGDLSTTDNNPVRFRGSTGRLQAGLEFDGPLTRLAERNQYRSALIDYQQARREYYSIEDRIHASLRDTIRTIRLNQLNFELQRAAVFVAIARVDEAGERLTQPGGAQLGVTMARDLVEALQALLRAQNSFVGIWTDQEALRMNLDLDLGTMGLDARGMWIDPGPVGAVHRSDDGLPAAPFPDQGIEVIPLPDGVPVELDAG